MNPVQNNNWHSNMRSVRHGKVHCLSNRRDKNTPDIVFVHANGFTARTYLPLLEKLSRYSIMAPDLRGHGKTELSEGKRRGNWHVFRDDLIQLLEQFEAPPVLVGHSMGGTSSVLASYSRPDLVRGMVAFDPPILPGIVQFLMRYGVVSMRSRANHPLVRGARSRRRHFTSKEAAFERYSSKPPFVTWQNGFLKHYLQDGLVEKNGRLELACNPEWEAHNYMAHGHDIWGAIHKVKRPCLLIGGNKRGAVLGQDILEKLARSNPLVEPCYLPGTGHFLPMEDSKTSARLIDEFMKSLPGFPQP